MNPMKLMPMSDQGGTQETLIIKKKIKEREMKGMDRGSIR